MLYTLASQRKGSGNLRKSFDAEHLLADFLNNSSVGLAILDDQLRYRALNDRLAQMNGLAIESHLGRTVRDVLGKVALQVEPAIKHVFATGKPVFNFVLAGTLPSRGEATKFVDHLLPVKDKHGRVTHVGAVVVEVRPKTTERDPLGEFTEAKLSPHTEGNMLRSWKEIASYVGACVKTVQRWEQQYSFPVRRLDRSKGAIVFSLKSEVDKWLETRSQRAS